MDGPIMKLTYHGHSCFLLDGRDRVLVDPFITDNPVAKVRLDEIECDIIAVTHGHRGHLGDAIEISKRTKAPVVAIHEVAKYVEQFTETISMNKGGTVEVGHTKLTLLDAIHSSGIHHAEYKHEGGEAASFIIDTEFPVYHAGDTALFSDMRLIGEIYGPIVAILPIGDRFTMGIVEAARAVELLNVRKVVPMHFNTWPTIQQDPGEFKKLVESRTKCEVIVMNVGETIDF